MPSSRTACLTVSPSPHLSSLSVNVSKVSIATFTSLGCQNAPNKFFPLEVLTPVLPPTDASDMASKVVGMLQKDKPRKVVAAANPTMSVVTPIDSWLVWETILISTQKILVNIFVNRIIVIHLFTST